MFDDTVKKNVPGFDWTPEEQHQLEMVGDIQVQNADLMGGIDSWSAALYAHYNPTILRFQRQEGKSKSSGGFSSRVVHRV
ncbi:hypothetical protein ANCCAN_29360 [Ancylostoma caninum]|uniref:Uncharacterized protein n=1 Tax=Ancylostoma caninum TaxID=29170 RepID=A0A368EYN8_ANCCA|nr:hypothetical protein ANCCAN_29360 [Ancylostoma caninum]